MMRDLKEKRVTVMGLGRFGGGVAAARFLAECGARVTVTDLATEAELAESLRQLDGIAIESTRLGGHHEDDFRRADLIVVNPAVRPDNRFLGVARKAGVPLTTEINLFWRLNRGRTIGVTGSNGKSTTSALIQSILRTAGHRAWLGGNIGTSLLPHIEEIGPDDWCVLELSSFQLQWLDRIRASPDVAVVTNFSANHLDRHGTIDSYRHAKQAILRWQSNAGIAVLNGDDPDVCRWPANGRRVFFGQASRSRKPAGTDPEANASGSPKEADAHGSPTTVLPQNVQAATTAATAVGISAVAVREGIERFEPLPHRLQFVAEAGGRCFYNDSKATTPESTIFALTSFEQQVGPLAGTQPRRVILLAGGYDKQVDLGPMARAIAARTKAVALMGQTAGKLEALLRSAPNSRATAAQCRDANLSLPETRLCRSLEEAFRWAVEQSSPGDIVLLSPGCASYDWFRDFTERGDRFVQLVRRWSRQFEDAPHCVRGLNIGPQFV